MRSLFWICAVLAVTLGVMSSNLWRELRNERALAESLRSQVVELPSYEPVVTQARSPEATAASIAAPTTPTGRATWTKPSIASVYAAQAADAEAARLKAAEYRRGLWNDPAYRDARLAQIRALIPGSHPGLAEELGLSAAETDAMFDRLAEHELNLTALSAALPTAADSEAHQLLQRQMQALASQHDKEIAALLGSSRYTQWQKYQQAAPARAQAASLSSALADAGLPLDPTQVRSLNSILVAQFRHRQQPEHNHRVLAAMQPVVNTRQLAELRTLLEQQDALSRAMQRARDRAISAQRMEAR